MAKLKFRAEVDFEIDENEAAELLASDVPGLEVERWLSQNCSTADVRSGDHYRIVQNYNNIKNALGEILANRKVNERRMLQDVSSEVVRENQLD